MKIFEKIGPLLTYLEEVRKEGKSIGFVPTMGALHEGHMSLVRRSKMVNGSTVCSIFVNPVQFNNPVDLEKYPRPLDEDISLLEKEGCDALFVPDEKEVYPEPVTETFDFGDLDQVMEGHFRPGHFNGVAIVVKRFFEIVAPDRAYFGEKDYQQLLIIREMVKQTGLPVRIIPIPTVREAGGLAMSSRNRRLLPEMRSQASVIYKALCGVKEKVETHTLEEARKWALEKIESVPGFKVEYFVIADDRFLRTATTWDDFSSLVACTAVWAGEVRLIDNMLIV
ncbi:MAG: pantoate--beta-alanine ligase [Bacteroidetes bacterium]|nr:pantoate--beta-alanine ligase [Bacteroidota bacterium]